MSSWRGVAGAAPTERELPRGKPLERDWAPLLGDAAVHSGEGDAIPMRPDLLDAFEHPTIGEAGAEPVGTRRQR